MIDFMKLLLVGLAVVITLVNCAYPTSGLRVPDERPSIAIKGAPDDAILHVDGLNMGSARSFDGVSQVLLLEPGTHKVEVKSQGKTVLSEKIFLGRGEVKTIVVTSGGKQ